MDVAASRMTNKDIANSTYVYRTLCPNREEIRLLQLLPVPRDSQIRVYGQLTTVSLRDNPSFAALSYVCGDPSITENIVLNGSITKITANLTKALEYFSQQGVEFLNGFHLWVDAVCIKQDDVEEKNQQVKFMSNIYGAANHVYSWLGDAPYIPLAFKALRSISQDIQTVSELHPELLILDVGLEREDVLIPNRLWAAPRDLVDLPYWSRMWIFQEIALSKPHSLTFTSPGAQMSDDELENAISNLRCLVDRMVDEGRPAVLTDDMRILRQRLPLLVNSLKMIQRLLVAKAKLAGTQNKMRPPLCILSAYTHLTRATDPRDYYYSLIGVAKLALEPDYGPAKSVGTACIDFVEAFLVATRNTPYSLLFLHDAVGLADAGDHDDMPSWAHGYHLPMENRERGPSWIAQADKGHFDYIRRAYPSLPRLMGEKLYVLGIRMSTVNHVGERPSLNFLQNGAMRKYLIDFAGRHAPGYISGLPLASAFYALLMRQPDGICDARAILLLLERLASSTHENDATDMAIWSGIERYFRDSIQNERGQIMASDPTVTLQGLVEALSMFEVLNIGHLFEISEGFIGLAPLGVTTGDILCVLDRFQYPVILRQADHQAYPLYEFVGPCFVMGLMLQGETKAFLKGKQAKPERLRLK
ncbi:uncharacterized protein N7496_004461 [Penicillium cataractarum]|uniref:Heterokaryon incompatibility domain-containing protein n=1 Tax=Penicillium cataractarum TaxID=2100454 RepID=A0A9W9ST82_9EURO|nr:uncharacterized protein N7496_004461 [Penicillium cataractarum]KAJ5382033.1 hypothetical protein N7496_004461 [Penicillium cataractarum]